MKMSTWAGRRGHPFYKIPPSSCFLIYSSEWVYTYLTKNITSIELFYPPCHLKNMTLCVWLLRKYDTHLLKLQTKFYKYLIKLLKFDRHSVRLHTCLNLLKFFKCVRQLLKFFMYHNHLPRVGLWRTKKFGFICLRERPISFLNFDLNIWSCRKTACQES